MKIYIEIEMPDNFEGRLDMQSLIEQEIKADRWSWHSAPNETKQGCAHIDKGLCDKCLSEVDSI